MTMMRAILVTLPVLATVVHFSSAPAKAHDWYPIECCNSKDCAPVENVTWFVPAGAGMRQLVVTSKHGTATIPANFPVRESKDGRMHVCIRQNEFGHWDVMCLFMPPPA
jgi:hypothetical protein